MKMNGGFTVVKLTGYAIVYNLQLEQRRGGRGNFLQVVCMYNCTYRVNIITTQRCRNYLNRFFKISSRN